MYDEKIYNICPRCEQENIYELGLQISQENKKIREEK